MEVAMESWRDIKGYEGYYQVSNLGNVRAVERTTIVEQARYDKPRVVKRRAGLLKQHRDGKGYPMVRLCRLGIVKTINVHRLVALAFIDNPLNKPAVNHIDADPFNNRADNLEWCTIAENNAHTHKLGRAVKACTYKKYGSKAPGKKRSAIIPR